MSFRDIFKRTAKAAGLHGGSDSGGKHGLERADGGGEGVGQYVGLKSLSSVLIIIGEPTGINDDDDNDDVAITRPADNHPLPKHPKQRTPSLPHPQPQKASGRSSPNGVSSVGDNSPSAITPPLSQPQGQEGWTLDEEEDEWQIVKTLGKRRTRIGNEYKVQWQSTWKPANELGNARHLVQEFET